MFREINFHLKKLQNTLNPRDLSVNCMTFVWDDRIVRNKKKNRFLGSIVWYFLFFQICLHLYAFLQMS